MTGSWDYNTPHEPRVYSPPLSSARAVKNTSQPDPSQHTHTEDAGDEKGKVERCCVHAAGVRVSVFKE